MDRATLIGMTTGAAFMFGFGAIWLLLGLFRGRRSPISLQLALLLAGIILAAAIFILGRHASSLPANTLTPQQLALNRDIARHFYLVFGAELAAIALAVIVLNLIHYPAYILSGIAIIVGVHFFPLAALFNAPLYYATGALGCAIGIAGFLVANDGLRQKVVGLSFGIMLWATASCILWTALSATHISPAVRMM